jgi:hypothetical protein
MPPFQVLDSVDTHTGPFRQGLLVEVAIEPRGAKVFAEQRYELVWSEKGGHRLLAIIVPIRAIRITVPC